MMQWNLLFVAALALASVSGVWSKKKFGGFKCWAADDAEGDTTDKVTFIGVCPDGTEWPAIVSTFPFKKGQLTVSGAANQIPDPPCIPSSIKVKKAGTKNWKMKKIELSMFDENNGPISCEAPEPAGGFYVVTTVVIIIQVYTSYVYCPVGGAKSCSCRNDPHCISFIGKPFEYQVTGSHDLAKLAATTGGVPAFTVSSEFLECSPGSEPTCLNTITVETLGHVIEVDKTLAVKDNSVAVENSMLFPFYSPADASKIVVGRDFYCVWINVSYSTANNLSVSFCGTDEQVMLTSGLVAAVYASLTGICIEAEDTPVENPPADQTEAEAQCTALIKATTAPFYQCYNKQKNGVAKFMYDTCVVDFSVTPPQVCGTLQAFEKICMLLGYTVGDWQTPTNCVKRCKDIGKIWYGPGCTKVCQCTKQGVQECWTATNWPPTTGASCTTKNGVLGVYRTDGGCADPNDQNWRQKYVCCNKVLWPKKDDQDEMRLTNCCGLGPYSADEFLCCGGACGKTALVSRTAEDGETEKFNQCCGLSPFNVKQSDCCNPTKGTVAQIGQCTCP